MPVLYRNGSIRLDGTGRSVAALLTDGGRVVAHDADPPAGTTVIDLDGAWVTPAFVDAHVHTTGTGLALSGLDLSGATSLSAALGAVAAAARSARGRPVLGGGWDDTRWPDGRAPTAHELDRASFGGVVYLARVDAHSAVASSALLASVPGIADLAGYRSDGHLTRAAHDAARIAAFDALDPGRIRDLQRVALRHAASLGIACVHEMAGPAISSEEDLGVLQALVADEPLPEVIAYWGELFGVEAARSLGAIGAAGDLFCDGSLGSHTAALHAPYDDRPDTTGMVRFETPDLVEHIVQCERAGLQAGFHAIGDAAVDQVVDAYLGAAEQLGRPLTAGHRIEHVEYVRSFERLASTGVVASMQPMFDGLWGGADGMYATRLGSDRAAELNRFASCHAAGVPLAFGSDAPVTELGPWPAIWAAVRPSDPSAGVPFAAAFAAHTSGGWRAARRTGGTLDVGAAATLAVWSHEPSHGEVPECLGTVRDGVVLHDSGLLDPLAALR